MPFSKSFLDTKKHFFFLSYSNSSPQSNSKLKRLLFSSSPSKADLSPYSCRPFSAPNCLIPWQCQIRLIESSHRFFTHPSPSVRKLVVQEACLTSTSSLGEVSIEARENLLHHSEVAGEGYASFFRREGCIKLCLAVDRLNRAPGYRNTIILIFMFWDWGLSDQPCRESPLPFRHI